MKILHNLLTVLVILVTLAVGVLFALQNNVPVPLNLLIYTFEPQSFALWILVAFAMGGVLGMIVSSAILVRTRASLGSCRRQLERARTEASTLRGTNAVVDPL
ncbi:MAG TPA: LapA family protein [Halioglobus sp.]